MIFSGHLTTSKLSKLSKMPSLLHQCFLTLISTSHLACAQILVDMAKALYSNRTQQVHGTSFRLDHDSSLTPKPVMQLLNLKCLPYAGLSQLRAMKEMHNKDSETLCLQELRKYAEEYQLLRTFILDGFPKQRKQLPESCRRYWNVHQQLSLDDDLIVYVCRLLIPTKMRRQVLTNLHEAHQGALRTKQHARRTIYWPGLDDIDNIILNCQHCQDHLSLNVKEPIIQKSQPARPFQEVAVDLCSYAGHEYLIMVDCHTDWPDIIPLTHNTTESQITTALRQAFCRTAIPDVLWSDGGPQDLIPTLPPK